MYRFTLRGVVNMIEPVYKLFPASSDHQTASSCYFATTAAANNIDHNYERAIAKLNTLQSNYSALQDSIKFKHQDESKHISNTEKFLNRIHISSETLNRLAFIHVAGTKGKGSTCAMVESILRFNGYRTGFFSSPHLVSVTERIRLDGQPIGKESFVEHFWKIYNQLFAAQQDNNDMPTYFGFLTILALDVFLTSKVDVTILEVGIGGRYDCTNVIQNTPVVGITSLGLEHTKLLGDTLEEIAWQKAGIIKNGSDVFTVEQPAECNRIIERECMRKKANLHIVPSSLEEFLWEKVPSMMMKQRNKTAELNVSLAVQIATNWMRRTRPCLLPTVEQMIPAKIVQGIDNCFWPGRLQVLEYAAHRTLFLDGAHTADSIKVCAGWFKNNSHSNFKKLLLFNSTGDRDGFKMLSALTHSVNFDGVCFTPNVAFSASCSHNDSVNHNFPLEQQMGRCELYREYWTKQLKQRNASVHDSVQSAFQYLHNTLLTSDEPCDILVTGSIHLLGATISALHLESKLFSHVNKIKI